MGWVAEVLGWLTAAYGWFDEWRFVNLVLPAVLPLFVLIVPYFISGNPLGSPWVTVKDGQLAWAALGMCTAAFYDLRHPSSGMNVPADWEHVHFWILLLATLGSAVYAGVAPMYPTGAVKPLGFWAGVKHFRVFGLSVALTIYMAYLYAEVHLTTQAA